MEAVKLSDLMGTRYIIDDFARRVTIVLNKEIEKDSNVIIDLSRCKFGPKSAEVINSNMGRIKFINSTDAELNKLCEENHSIALNSPEVYPTLEVPKEFYHDELKEWIVGTPTGKYTIKLDLSNYSQELATVLFIMARPDCELDITNCIYDIFNIIKNHVDFDGVEDVLMLEAPYCYKCKLSEVAMSTSCYIPYDIGTKRLLSFTDNISVPKRYMDVIRYCAENLCEKFKQEEQESYYTNILDLLKFRGEEEDE